MTLSELINCPSPNLSTIDWSGIEPRPMWWEASDCICHDAALGCCELAQGLVQWLILLFVVLTMYSRITSTKSLSFCMTALSFTNLMAVLPQSRDCNCYIHRQILAPPALGGNTLIYIQATSLTLPTCDISLGWHCLCRKQETLWNYFCYIVYSTYIYWQGWEWIKLCLLPLYAFMAWTETVLVY